MKKMGVKELLILIVVVSALSLSGCAPQLKRFANWGNTNEDTLQTSVHMLTNAFLSGKPYTAQQVTQILGKMRAGIAAGTFTNAGTIQPYIEKEMTKLAVTDADKIIIKDLSKEIQKKIEYALSILNLPTPSDQLVEIDKILGWVVEISSVIK